MPRKLITTVIVVSLALVVGLLVAYAEPLRHWHLTRKVEKQFAIPTSSSNAPRLGANASRQVANADDGGVEKTGSLSLQPEAAKLLRRVGGERFKSRTNTSLSVQGVLKTTGDSHTVSIVRGQTDDGERVEVFFSDGVASLVWTPNSGPQNSSGTTLSQAQRILLERLAYDSADQFILAQLRGASYSVVICNLRPDDAGDEYTGPLWDVVRVDDPERDEQKRPLSPWRLYYINRTTGLIDKVISEVGGERVEAQFSDWTDRNGEKFPASITWSRGGQTVMTFNLINVSVASH
jgi:hypothetical protein